VRRCSPSEGGPLAGPHSKYPAASRCSLWALAGLPRQQHKQQQARGHLQQQQEQQTVRGSRRRSSSRAMCGLFGPMRTSAWRSGGRCCQSMPQQGRVRGGLRVRQQQLVGLCQGLVGRPPGVPWAWDLRHRAWWLQGSCSRHERGECGCGCGSSRLLILCSQVLTMASHCQLPGWSVLNREFVDIVCVRGGGGVAAAAAAVVFRTLSLGTADCGVYTCVTMAVVTGTDPKCQLSAVLVYWAGVRPVCWQCWHSFMALGACLDVC
jgi:hypothetical protein